MAIYNLPKNRVLETDCFATARNDDEILKQVQDDEEIQNLTKQG